MKNALILATWFLSCAVLGSAGAFASGCDHPSVYFVEGKKHGICGSSAVHAWLSSECDASVQTRRCGALELLGHAAEFSESREKGALADPGAVVCQRLGGQVVLGSNERGSQNSFCQAKDGTLVDLSSLHLAQVRTRKAPTDSPARNGEGSVGSVPSATRDKSVPKNR